MLSIDEVKHIAKLSNLKLTDEELEQFRVQLSSILDYVRQLNEVDTENVEPTFQVGKLKNVFQDVDYDKFHNQQKISKNDALKNASNQEDGYFTTKAVLPT